VFPDAEGCPFETSEDSNQATQGHTRQERNPHFHQVSNYGPNYPFAKAVFQAQWPYAEGHPITAAPRCSLHLIQGVSGGIANILGGGSMDYSE